MKNNTRQHADMTLKSNNQCTDEACDVPVLAFAPPVAYCPVSQTRSRKVYRQTLEHLLTPANVSAIRNVQYYYCHDSECEIVYFSHEDVPPFTVHDLNVKIFGKNARDDVPVCYCFDWTRGRIKEQLVHDGASTAAIEIAREVKAGTCSCDVKNPKGQCCLGDVRSYIASINQHQHL